MIFANKVQQYPNLVAYLRETERFDPMRGHRSQWAWMMAVAFLAPIFLLPAPFNGIVALIAAGGVGFKISRDMRKLRTPEMESKIEALRLFASLRRMMQLNRLHRDLSESALTVLDEIARLRYEIKSSLSSGYWQLPEKAHSAIHQQSLLAVDQAMMDAVIQFRGSIPATVDNRQILDYVDEGLETLSKFPRKGTKFIEPGFDAAFQIAQKLQELKREIESMTALAEADPLRDIPQKPGSLLDLTMAEIRTVKDAENELRQGL